MRYFAFASRSVVQFLDDAGFAGHILAFQFALVHAARFIGGETTKLENFAILL